MNCRCRPLFAAEFSIWTREAGAGGLSIAVEGPSKAEITFEDRKDGSCGVAYVVQEPGERNAMCTTEERKKRLCKVIVSGLWSTGNRKWLPE